MRDWTRFSPDAQTRSSACGALCFAREAVLVAAVACTGPAGASPTLLLRDVQPGPTSGFTTAEPRLFEHGARLVFYADDGVNGLEPWISDGTPAGTRRVIDETIPDFSIDATSSTVLSIGSRFFFLGRDAATGNEPRVTNGDASGTRLLVDATSGTGSSSFSAYLRLHGQAYWAVGGKLWASDGTVPGTGEIFVPGDASISIVNLQGRLLLNGGGNLYLSDGTTSGSAASGSLGASGVLLNRTVVNGKAVFARNAIDTGSEPGVTDGTTGGSMILKDIVAETGIGSSPNMLGVIDDYVLFTAPGPFGTSGLWRTDGTPAGTAHVKNITGSASVVAGRAAFLDGVAYFLANDGTNGIELWRSDGTAAGTYMVADVEPAVTPNPPSGRHVTRINRSIMFTADDGVHGPEPWISDGTAAGTRLLEDVAPGPTGSNPRAYAAAGGHLFMVASTAQAAQELHAKNLLDETGGSPEWCVVPQAGLADQTSDSFEIALPATQGAVADADVSFDVSHARVGDLKLTLSHGPSGRSAVLVDALRTEADAGCTGANLVVRLDDEAATMAQQQCSDASPAYARRTRYRPRAALSVFDGVDAAGPWTLTVQDTAPQHGGTVHEWCVHLKTDAGFRDGFE